MIAVEAVITGVYFVVWDFNRINIMKLIDIEIDETGTYYILTDEIEPETGDNVEAEFFRRYCFELAH